MEIDFSHIHKYRYELQDVVDHREALRQQGKRVVLANGCFDLLHTGHLFYLRKAAALGDALFIALNGDASVRALKGPSRPVQNQNERAYMMAALDFVDTVFIFDTPRLDQEILALNPDVYAKAGDYTRESLDSDERKALDQVNADIQFVPFMEGYSTTQLIARIAKAAKTF